MLQTEFDTKNEKVSSKIDIVWFLNYYIKTIFINKIISNHIFTFASTGIKITFFDFGFVS